MIGSSSFKPGAAGRSIRTGSRATFTCRIATSASLARCSQRSPAKSSGTCARTAWPHVLGVVVTEPLAEIRWVDRAPDECVVAAFEARLGEMRAVPAGTVIRFDEAAQRV